MTRKEAEEYGQRNKFKKKVQWKVLCELTSMEIE